MTLFHSPFRALLALAIAIIVAYSRSSSSRMLNVEPGDVVVVTGSSTGIGKHAALSLAREGYVVFACVRKTEHGDALIRSAETFGVDPNKIKPIILDATNSKHISQGVKSVASFVGDRGLRGLFNNAGIASVPASQKASLAVEHTDLALFRKTFDVNFFGLVEVTQAFLPLLRKGGGRVVMNSSVAGWLGGPFFSAYASSKHAVEGFSDSLRRELDPLGVKVSVIEPGYVTTPLFSGYIPEGLEPYSEAERKAAKVAWKSAIGAPSPRVTSEAVIHAMRAQTPKIRYIVGKDAGILKIIRNLPFSWVDAMLRSMNENGDEISVAELTELTEEARKEFSL
eukprot:CAMPEP_0197438876 /NCGR_PEP_ID=MMETSP1175-20131217/5756_1 /TAXON_ID=1003142 /ORGANISM="Triceratium dubium, Strain CCMP147" /LENGTH=338 /DNA_ID=CAMNT_0042968689 /DNA_START=27 /DNA_END=1043 /DNA_ORIENTATION=+